MLTILLTAFLSFSSVSSTMNAKSHELNFVTKDDSISGDTYQPKADISYGEYDVGTTYNGIIARHQMISIDSSEYLGPIVVDKLTSTYNAAALENFHFNERISTVEDSTVSTSIELSSEITSGLGVKMNMDGVVISRDYAIKDIYKIEDTITYSYSEEISKDVSYDAKKELIAGKHFYLGSVAYTYKVKFQSWQYDDYWWGDYEVGGSHKKFDTYLTLEPYITICFEDSSFIK